ncbi:hypothetical protein BJ912DRAFT_993653 [Pholiota molesta]|nr:hypothetical protein BJ912DRAFT_993653 [Pholiota molesta]
MPALSCSVCDKSQSEDATILQCSRCQDRFYCGRECQLADWRKHRRFCGIPRKWYDKYRRCRDDNVHEGDLELITWPADFEGHATGTARLKTRTRCARNSRVSSARIRKSCCCIFRARFGGRAVGRMPGWTGGATIMVRGSSRVLAIFAIWEDLYRRASITSARPLGMAYITFDVDLICDPSIVLLRL